MTQVLEPLNNFAGIDPAVLSAKAALGTAVHVACELDDANDLVEESVHDSVRPYLEAWRRFKTDKQPEILSCEQRVFHPLHRYAGTLDRCLQFDGLRWLVDLKSSVTIYPSVGPQTAAYLAAKGDVTITRRAALQLRDDGTYRLHPLNDPNDFGTFLACLAIYRFKEKHQ